MSKILRKTRKPGIPRANTQDQNIKRTLDALTEGYEVGEGMRGNLLDAKVTWRDLQEAGIAQVQDMSIYYGGVGSGGGGMLVVNPSAPVPDMSVPPVPTGFKVNGAFSVTVLSWDSPFNQYNNHSHTEIWRSETDNFGQAVKIGTSQGVMFSDAIGNSASNYYWIRFVSTTDVQGPINDTKGTFGKTAENPEYLMGVLTDEYGGESASPFFQLDEDTWINGTLVPAGTYMKNAYVVNLTANNFVGKKIVADEVVVGISFSSPVITGGQITVANAGITDEGTVNIWAGASYAWRDSAPFKVYSNGLVDTSAITIRDALGNVLLSSGTGMEWEYVTGAGKPANNATVGATFEPGHGQVQGQITPSNVSTFIADAAITNAKIGNIIQSTVFNSSTGWKINKDGSADFRGVVITRPNVVDSGTWINPNEGSTNVSTSHFRNVNGRWRTNQHEDASYLEYDFESGWTERPDRGTNILAVYLSFDTSFDDFNEVAALNRGAFVVHAKATNGYNWHGSTPLPGIRYKAIVQAAAATSVDFYTTGASGTAGGRIRVVARIPLPQDIASDITAIRIDRISWSLMRIT